MRTVTSLFSKAALAATVIAFFNRLTWRLSPLPLLLSIISGALFRLFSILSFVVSLKAILVTINPELFTKEVNRKLSEIGSNTSLTEHEVIYVLAAATIMTFVANYAFLYVNTHFLTVTKRNTTSALSRQNIDKVLLSQNLYKELSTQDAFVYSKIDSLITHYVKFCQIIVFMLFFFSIITFFSWEIATATLFLSAFMAITILAADKSRLRELADIQELKSKYLEFSRKSGLPPKESLEENKYRHRYIRKKQDYDRKKTLRENTYLPVLGLAIATMVLLIGTGNFLSISGQTLLIFLVFSIRYLINYGKELGQALSALLDFRPHLNSMEIPKRKTIA